MSKSKDNVQSARDAYNTATSNFDTAKTGFNSAANIYTGNRGYRNALTQANAGQAQGNASARNYSTQQNELANSEAQKYAQQQANATAQNTRNAVQTATRNSGMSKAQAAALGSQQIANAFNDAYANAYQNQMNSANNNYTNQQNQYNNQQNVALNAGNQAVNAAQTNAQNQNTSVTNAQNQQQLEQTENQNKWNRGWGAVGSGLQSLAGIGSTIAGLFSDERLKKYKDISTKMTNNNNSSLIKTNLPQGVKDFLNNVVDIGTDVLAEVADEHIAKYKKEKEARARGTHLDIGYENTMYSDERLKKYHVISRKIVKPRSIESLKVVLKNKRN